MAEQNICTVDLLQDMTTDTNALVEENGELKRVNLDREKTKLTTEISTLNTQIFNMKNQISELENSNAELEIENADLEKSVAELNGKFVFEKKYFACDENGYINIYKSGYIPIFVTADVASSEWADTHIFGYTEPSENEYRVYVKSKSSKQVLCAVVWMEL